MRARRLRQPILPIAAALIALAGWWGAAATSWADGGLPEPLCWRQQAFSIPFKVASAESPDQQPAEVRLYVSTNQGTKWDLAQQVSPQQRNFTFRAPHDGEYWFQIRTADRQGHISPEVGGKPELRVIVDTIPPRLDLTATRGEAGEVKASWQAVDPLLNAESLKIEYQTAAGSWRPVAIDRSADGMNRSTSTGTLTWFPTDAPAVSVAVRAEISDRAGNVTVSQAQAERNGASAKHELTTSNSAAKPSDVAQNWISTPNAGWSNYTTSPANSAGPNANSAAQNSGMATRTSPPLLPNSAPALPSSGPQFPGATATSPNARPGLSNSAGAMSSATSFPASNSASGWGTPSSQFAGSNRGPTSWPADHASDLPLGRNPIPTDDLTARSPVANPPQADYPSSFADSASQSYAPANRSGEIAARAVENVNPPIRNQVLPDSGQFRSDGFSPANLAQRTPTSSPALSIPSSPAAATATDKNSSSAALLPPGERPRMVNSRSFDLEYEVDGIGPSGIAKVELWGTRDGGHTWNSYGVDDDNRSPIRANVEGEGLYGFRIVVQSGSGLGSLPPRSGDAPDLWVMVDLTKPNVRLIDATVGEGPHSGELLIRWQASDAALAARPISLLFSDRPGGPWSIIAAGLENTGQYAWRPDSRVPDRIYLRIEARDEAGNMGTFEAAQVVTLDRVRPEGRIRGVRPTNDTANRPSPVGDTATGPRPWDYSR